MECHLEWGDEEKKEITATARVQEEFRENSKQTELALHEKLSNEVSNYENFGCFGNAREGTSQRWKQPSEK